METVSYGGWPNCIRLTNGEVELIVTTDVGPRVIRYGFVGEQNEFHEFKDQLGKVGGDEWRIYGGHRLWHAPEKNPRSYEPYNETVPYEWDGRWLHLRPKTEANTGIRKEMSIHLSAEGSHVKIIHRIINEGQWTVKLAVWPLTVMAPGGKAIIPQEPYAAHTDELAPARPLVLWRYTRMDDPRWTWSSKYIQLRQDPNATSPQKLGALIKDGWAAYWRNNHLFFKFFPYSNGARYADYGCNMECFTNGDMLEVETLGPLTKLEPGGGTDHIEGWFLHKNVPSAEIDEDLDKVIVPLLKKDRKTHDASEH